MKSAASSYVYIIKMTDIQIIPHINIQHDWHEVILDIQKGTVESESFWVTCSCKDSPSIRGFVTVKKNKMNHESLSAVDLDIEGGVTVEMIDARTLKVSCPSLKISNVIVHAPKMSYKVTDSTPRIPRAINVMDISSGGALFVVGGDEGELKVGDLQTGEVMRKFKGHFGDITSSRFFPSDEVILSGASDFQLRIWSVLDGNNPVTLTGHRSGITDTAIIERGKNVISSSRDGTIILWECGGSSSAVATLGNYPVPINKIAIGNAPEEILRLHGDRRIKLDRREYGTDGKLLLAALDDGTLRGFDLGSKEEIFSTKVKSASLLAIAYSLKWSLIVTGDSEGVVEVYNIKDMSSPFQTFQRTPHQIRDLFIESDTPTLLVATGDGSVFRISSLLDTQDKVKITDEYSGLDLDPVCSLRVVEGKGLCTAARDGIVRVYS